MSQHDLTMISYMAAIDVFDWKEVPNGAAFFSELYETSPGEFAVHLARRYNTTDNEAHTVLLPGIDDI